MWPPDVANPQRHPVLDPLPPHAGFHQTHGSCAGNQFAMGCGVVRVRVTDKSKLRPFDRMMGIQPEADFWQKNTAPVEFDSKTCQAPTSCGAGLKASNSFNFRRTARGKALERGCGEYLRQRLHYNEVRPIFPA